MTTAETPTLLVHATTIALHGTAVLIRGEPGSGKSSLALQMLETVGSGLGPHPLTAQLLADDQTQLERQNEVLVATCPPAIRGLLEVRGLGIVSVVAAAPAPLRLVVDVLPAKAINRLPEEAETRTSLLGVSLPRLMLDAAHPSAPSRLRLAWVRVMNTGKIL
jgi:HPr kinase/phosphorylase